jgi:hypothetical protein
MEVTLTHQVMDERRECGEPHARSLARLASPGRGGAGRRALATFCRLIFLVSWLLRLS